MPGAETTLDGFTLVVRTPMRFQRRGGHKGIVAPDGRELAPCSKPQPDGTLICALGHALARSDYGTTGVPHPASVKLGYC